MFKGILVILSLVTLKLSHASEVQFRVYIIHSYLPGLWSDKAFSGLEKGLKFHKFDNYKIKQYDYNYVLQRKNKSKHLNQIKSEIISFSPNLIVIFDDEAAEDFIPSLNQLKIPIVATGINSEIEQLKWFKPDGDKERNFTAILERYPFEAPLKMLKKIRPEINKINILTTDNDSSNIITSQILKKFSDNGNSYAGIKIDKTIKSKDWNDWKNAIRLHRKADEAFWILVPWDVYEDGKEVSIKRIGTFYQSESTIPELGIVNASQLLGFLLCFSVNSEDLAFEAISTAINAEKNKISLSNIPFTEVKSARVVINKKRADELKLKIPIELLDFAKLEKKIPLNYLR